MSKIRFNSQDIAINFGSTNTVIIKNDKIVIKEPSVITIDKDTGKMITIGNKADNMVGIIQSTFKRVRPFLGGRLMDYDAAEKYIKAIIKMISPGKKISKQSYRMLLCLPSGLTTAEQMTMGRFAKEAGGKEIFKIERPIAVAIGFGIDVEEPKGSLIVHIGGSITDICVIALGRIVVDNSIRLGGNDFTADIEKSISGNFNIFISEKAAEKVKQEVGAALTNLDNSPSDYNVYGRDKKAGIPKEVFISYKETAQALDQSIGKIEEAIIEALEKSPPELLADIQKSGVYLAGSGAMIRGIDKRISHKTKLPVNLEVYTDEVVARGLATSIKNDFVFPFLLKY